MASNIVPKNRRDSAADGETQAQDCYDRFVTEIASLQCVHDALVAHDLSGGEAGDIGSAELLLRNTIARLHDVAHNVLNLPAAAGALEVVSG